MKSVQNQKKKLLYTILGRTLRAMFFQNLDKCGNNAHVLKKWHLNVYFEYRHLVFASAQKRLVMILANQEPLALIKS